MIETFSALFHASSEHVQSFAEGITKLFLDRADMEL
jgi:hypothetical protein